MLTLFIILFNLAHTPLPIAVYQTTNIFNKLTATANTPITPVLRFSYYIGGIRMPNAMSEACEFSVTYTYDLIALTKSSDEAAFILAHELGHQYYMHCGAYGLDRVFNHNKEYLADSYGVELANKAGFRGCKGAKEFLTTFNYKADSTHPASKDRLKRICP